jgi:luciferase family oxidoreductase group 1
VPVSVLDLAPVPDGGNAGDALRATIELARHAEWLGFRRFWVAEHHNMPGITSSAPAVLIGHIADATRAIRVGSGGVMLPNHVSLVIAEQFGMLEALHPGRIDLGIGRAPGTDQVTAAPQLLDARDAGSPPSRLHPRPALTTRLSQPRAPDHVVVTTTWLALSPHVPPVPSASDAATGRRGGRPGSC